MPLESVRGQPLHTKWMASQVKDTAWLEWITGLMGVGSRQTHSATLLPGQFHCLLDELPLHLIPHGGPESQGWWQKLPHEDLFLNPQCSTLPAREVPAELEMHRDLLKDFYLQGTVALGARPGHDFFAAVLAGSAVGSGGCESSDRNARSGHCSQRRSLRVGWRRHSDAGRPR